MQYSLEHLIAETGGEQPQVAMIYGAPKTGKTMLAARFSDQYNLLWIDLDRGFQTALNVIKPSRYKNVIPIIVDDSPKDPNGIKTITRLVGTDADHKVCVAHGRVSCIPCTRDKKPINTINLYKLDTNWILVVDSVTRLADSALAHTLGPMDIDKRKKPEFDHWDAQGLLLRNTMKMAKQLPCHSIFVSHEEEIILPDGTKRIIPIGGTKANSRRIAQFADHVIYCQIKNQKHIAYSDTTSLTRISAGSRNNVRLEKGDDLLSLFKPQSITEETIAKFQFHTDDSPVEPDAPTEVGEDSDAAQDMVYTEDDSADETNTVEENVTAPKPVSPVPVIRQNNVTSANASTNKLLERLQNRRAGS